MATRRGMLGAAASLALPGPAALAQSGPGSPRRIGVLMSNAEADPVSAPRLAAFRQALQELGWREGENLRIELRWGEGRQALIRRQAAEMVALGPEAILANGTPVVAAVQPLTRSIPVVAALMNDPVGLGFVESLARPGANITGFTFINPGLIAKWASLLHEVAPRLRRAALLYSPRLNPWYPAFLAEIARGPAPLPLEIVPFHVEAGDDLRRHLAEAARQPDTGLVAGPDSFVLGRFGELAGLALAHRLPGISVYRQFAVEGGLMSYGPDVPDIFRRAAGYLDRILRGASPAALPVQEPVTFEFALNQRAALALGLSPSATLLAAADTVID